MASSDVKETAGGSKIRAARLSAQQFEVLIEFMQEHPHFAVGRASGGSYSKEEHDILWKTLSLSLNQTEGPIKSVTKWQKCWVDLKSNARSRAAKFRAMSLDGPMPTGSMFTQWDERVLQLLNDISANGNKYVPVVAQSPLQLLEVGFSEKLTNGSIRVHTTKSTKTKFHPLAPKPNGYHITENGTETMESTSSHDFNLIENLREAEEDMEELIAEVKSEGDDEWMDQNSERCGEAYPPGSISLRSDPVSPTISYMNPHILTSPDGHEEDFPTGGRPKKRKRDAFSAPFNVEDSLEKFSKKICGTLDRMAAAAEEANSIQHGMVTAMNRLASSFEQLLPIVTKVLSDNLKSGGSS